MPSLRCPLSFLFIFSALLAPLKAQESSALWGVNGEKWTPQSRLPDFSFAGYHSGEAAIPSPAVVGNVRDFGAVGDGVQDDTAAFIKAIDATNNGVLSIPAGKYKITDILWIKKPNLVLRGAGPDKTILFFPKGLEEVKPNPSSTTEGRPTSNYSWSGGFLWVQGIYNNQLLTPITSENKRGDTVITVENASKLTPGQRVQVEIRDDEQRSLLNFLYSGDSGDTSKIKKQVISGMVSKIVSIKSQEVTLERPLRYDLRASWKPVLKTFDPTVTETGIEDLTCEFPLTPYAGHFTEIGYNAIAVNGAADCWVRNIRVKNGDSGVFLSGTFCTLDGLVVESERTPNKNSTGHHGLTLGTDSLAQNFEFKTHFIHDISVDNFNTGNVTKNGKGTNLSLDHHRRAPYENLYTNLDLGEGSVVWVCGGGQSLGKHSAARGTFWNLKSKRDISPPDAEFGPDSLNFVGLKTKDPSVLDTEGKWFEAIAPEKLVPADLHAAQLERRLKLKAAP